MNDIDKEVASILDAYAAAVFAKDVAALMRLYDPAVRVFDAWGVWSHDGAEAWQRTVEGWLTSLGTERVKVSFDELRTTAAGSDAAIVSAIVSYASLAPGGEPLRDMQNRITWGLRRVGHVLRIVHEHTSVPIGFEDSKAILRREPAGR